MIGRSRRRKDDLEDGEEREDREDREDGRAPESPTDLERGAFVGVLKRTAREFQEDNLTDWAAALPTRC